MKQPLKQMYIQAVHLNSAKRALALLCPSALPYVLETELPDERREQRVRLRALLERLWDLDSATVSLVNGIVVCTKKLLTSRSTLSEAAIESNHLTLQRLNAWRLQLQQREGGAGPGGFSAGAKSGGGDCVEGGGGAHGKGEAMGEVDGGDVSGSEDGADEAAGAVGRGAVDGPPRPAPAGAAPNGRSSQAVANAARRPTAGARSHRMDRSTNEPLDPRCLRPNIKALGETVHKDFFSFAIAITIDPVVNAFKPRHAAALSKLSDMLRTDDGLAKTWRLKQRVALTPGAKPPPEVPYLQPQGNRLEAVVAFGALNAEQPVGGEADTPAAGAAVDTPDEEQPPRTRKGGLPVDASDDAPPANTSEAGAAGDAPGVGVPAGAADGGVPADAVDIVPTADTAAARAAEDAPGRSLPAGAPDGAM